MYSPCGPKIRYPILDSEWLNAAKRNLMRVQKFKKILVGLMSLLPMAAYASFIESTMGAAVVNDATATLYNPAALILLKNPQVIGLGSIAFFHNEFTGQATQVGTGFTQQGSAGATTHYYLPSLYFGVPLNHAVSFGAAVVSNFFNRDIDGNSLLRYVQSANNIQGVDLIPAIGIKLSDSFSMGLGLNFSRATFNLQSVTGFPSLNVPDSESSNKASGSGVGSDVGVLYKLSARTVMGFNYRSAVTYKLSGSSTYNGTTVITSDNYHFTFWTPSRAVFSINHFLTPTFGLIGTVQRIGWHIFQNVNVHGIPTQLGTTPTIVDATLPYRLHDSWVVTFGGHYRATPRLVVRIAGSYIESPGNGHYQLSNGDSAVLGASVGYELTKMMVIDGSYAHAFIENQDINITTARNTVTGENTGYRDSVSVKLTLNI